MPEHRRLKISYIMPDFDEFAYSSGLYVIFQHCNGLIGRGHEVRAFNNSGKKSRYLRLDCQVEPHKNDPSRVEGNAPEIIVGTYWHTYFFINRMKDIVKNNTKLCFLIQSNDRAIYSDEDRQFISEIMAAKYKNSIPIHKIVISQYLKEMVKSDFGQDAFYVRNGFEPKEVEPLLPESEKIRIAARYDPSTFRGWGLVNEVLGRVSRKRDDIEIHLFEMKDKKPTKYKSIFHKGLSGEKLLRLFRSCDIYISGSRYEGFSYPIIEAMSQGSSVCCTDAGGNREYCIDGETVLMVPRDDIEGLYQNLLRLLDDKNLRARISANGIKKSRAFPW
jgi:glycosyltransferase involved in cell wall biosynthesis